MNKDVIYIEPEDDITDIITKIEKAKEKIVALVPPKKAGVFRSIVNVKLIAKAGASAEKSVVLVTMDPSIVKLAAATKLPVAKNLQSAPVIPTVGEEGEQPVHEHTIEDLPDDEEDADNEAGDEAALAVAAGVAAAGAISDLADPDADDSPSEDAAKDDGKDEAGDKENDVPVSKKSKKAQKDKAPKPHGNKFVNWFKNHKKLAIFSGVLLVALIAFLVWAFGFAPAADVKVTIKTDSRNFSETASFVTSPSEEDTAEGKLYLEQKKYENTQEVEFEATGEKNLGEKARGELSISKTLYADEQVQISAGDVFTYNGLSYTADSTVTMRYSKDDVKVCANVSEAMREEIEAGEVSLNRCEIHAKVKVTAAQGGTKYNISSKTSGWSSLSGVNISLDGSISGGTDDIKPVVQQSDVLKAEQQLTTAKEAENKQKLYESIGDDYYIIEVSFEQNTSNATSSPGVDQEVSSGTKPKLTATTTATVYVVEKSKIEEFIRSKAKLDDGQEIYDIQNIYVESLSPLGTGYTGRLKAQYYVGPKITESEVVDKIKGKGLGDAQREIRDLYGVSDVKIDTSYPWVMAIPGDSNKVTVTFEIKDQGSTSDTGSSDDTSSDSQDNKDNNNNEN